MKIILDWSVPHNWKISNSYGNNQLHQQVVTSMDDVLHSLYIGGDFQFYNVTDKLGNLTIAVQGKWPFTGDQFKKIVTKIIKNERKFWNDFAFPHYLVTLIPVNTTEQGMAGTGLANAFTLALKEL